MMSRIVVGREAELQDEREICIKEKQWSCRKSRGAVGRKSKYLGRARELMDEQETCVMISRAVGRAGDLYCKISRKS